MSQGSPTSQTGAVSYPQMPKTPNWVSVILLVVLFGLIQFTLGINLLPWWGWVLVFIAVAVIQLLLESVVESWLAKRWQRKNPRWATKKALPSELADGDWVRLTVDGRSLDWACRVSTVEVEGQDWKLVMGCGHSARQHPEVVTVPRDTAVEVFLTPLA